MTSPTDIVITSAMDLAKCLNLNSTVVKYGILNDKIYINLTELCKAGKRKYKHWHDNDDTKEFLDVLTDNQSDTPIIEQNRGGQVGKITWGIPQVAIKLAQWISSDFSVRVTNWIFELMTTGKVELGKETHPDLLNKKLIEQYQKQLLDVEMDRNSLVKQCETLKTEAREMKLEARSNLENMIEKIDDNRNIMLFKYMAKHLKPVYIKAISAEEICSKFPRDMNPAFQNWYVVNEPLIRKESIESGIYDDSDNEDVDLDDTLSDGLDSDDESEDDSDDDIMFKDQDEVVENKLIIPATPEKIKSKYIRYYQNLNEQFYRLDTKAKRGEQYAMILYAKPNHLKCLVDYFRKHKIYETPDPNVFETNISEVENKLVSLFLST